MSEDRLRRWTGPARSASVGLGSAAAVLTLFPGSWTLAQVGAELSVSADDLSRVWSLGVLGFACGAAGAVLRRSAQRRARIGLLAGVAAASLLCVLADSAITFTIARSIQGVLAGAALVFLGTVASESAGHTGLPSAAALLCWFAVGPSADDEAVQFCGWTGLYVGQAILAAATALEISVAE